MPKQQSIVSLDPIAQKKQKGFLGRLLVTTYHGGKPVQKTEPFGHYMFCGPQRSGKTASSIWFAEYLLKKYRRKKIKYKDEDGNFVKFDELPKVKLWSNFGIGKPFIKSQLFKLIDELDPYANEVRIFIIDEIHTYFPRGGQSKELSIQISAFNTLFSQLAKRNCYVLSTAQVYGRLDKAMREQCLYMVDCRVNIRGRIVNDFILETDIIADDLGRWAGNPKFIKTHGLATLEYDTKKLIRE